MHLITTYDIFFLYNCKIYPYLCASLHNLNFHSKNLQKWDGYIKNIFNYKSWLTVHELDDSLPQDKGIFIRSCTQGVYIWNFRFCRSTYIKVPIFFWVVNDIILKLLSVSIGVNLAPESLLVAAGWIQERRLPFLLMLRKDEYMLMARSPPVTGLLVRTEERYSKRFFPFSKFSSIHLHVIFSPEVSYCFGSPSYSGFIFPFIGASLY